MKSIMELMIFERGPIIMNQEMKVKNANKDKFGFMRYNGNNETIDVFSFNKLEDLANNEGFSVKDYMDIDKLKVGESVYDGAAYIYTRIW